MDGYARIPIKKIKWRIFLLRYEKLRPIDSMNVPYCTHSLFSTGGKVTNFFPSGYKIFLRSRSESNALLFLNGPMHLFLDHTHIIKFSYSQQFVCRYFVNVQNISSCDHDVMKTTNLFSFNCYLTVRFLIANLNSKNKIELIFDKMWFYFKSIGMIALYIKESKFQTVIK